jgi:outer membrane immunogenic protein
LPRRNRSVPASVYSPEPVAKQGANLFWNGGYIGAHLGLGFSNKYTGSNGYSSSGSGVLGGLQGGYDWQFNQFVVGLAADISMTSMSASSGGIRGEVDWTGSLRARAGYLVTNRLLAYGTGGLAFGGVEMHNGATSQRNTATGYTLGLGAEYAFTQHLSAMAEYRYTSLGRTGYGALGGVSYDTSFHGLRAGVNYRF